MRVTAIVLLLIMLAACSNSDDTVDIPVQPGTFAFQDGFEVAGTDLSMLFPNDNSRWSNVQQVKEGNEIEISQSTVLEGSNSLRIFAEASDAILSKMDIEKGGLIAMEGSTVRIEANFFIASNEDLENLFLIDLECCSCWDPTVPDNQCPGIRLTLKANDFLAIERGKILGRTISQTQVPFPRNQWVNLLWELTLSQNDDGQNRLVINGQEALSESGQNMPNAAQFEAEFAANGRSNCSNHCSMSGFKLVPLLILPNPT